MPLWSIIKKKNVHVCFTAYSIIIYVIHLSQEGLFSLYNKRSKDKKQHPFRELWVMQTVAPVPPHLWPHSSLDGWTGKQDEYKQGQSWQRKLWKERRKSSHPAAGGSREQKLCFHMEKIQVLFGETIIAE